MFRSMRRGLTLMAAVVLSLGALVAPPAATRAEAAPAGDDSVVAFVVRGVGNGHGRGLSQWGSFGRAIAGQSWQDILAAYYGGTVPGTASKPDLRVRLTPWDGVSTVGVISRGGQAAWNGSATVHTSMYAVETSPNQFDVYGATSGFGCYGSSAFVVPKVVLANGSVGQAVTQMQQLLAHFGFSPGPIDGIFGNQTEIALEAFQTHEGLLIDGTWDEADWNRAEQRLQGQDAPDWKLLGGDVTGPIRFSTSVDQSTGAAADVLGVCEPDGSITHYRGVVEFLHTGDGNRVVNEVDVENYLRGVVPKESPASWGDAANGAGMNALRAQSVAARSYALTQGRYSYAGTCDTPSCQVYGGSAIRVNASTANSVGVEHANTDSAIAATAGVVRFRAGTAEIVSTEFSASNGPRTAGGTFPAVDDEIYDDQPGNPLHRWTRIIDADAVMSRYGLSTAGAVRTEPAPPNGDPRLDYEGIWGNRVNLGNGSTVTAWDFRNAFGLPSPGFELIPVRRELTGAGSFAFIGDSVGVSIAGTDEAALPGSTFGALVEGVFAAVFHDAAGARPTVGSWFASGDGVDIARQVPMGTDLVVVELGYNDTPSAMSGHIDAVMTELRARDVRQVAWVNVSERRRSTDYATTNEALRAAMARWSELLVLDWNAASSHRAADRWFSDGVHLTSTGRAELSLFLRDAVVTILSDGYVPPRPLAPDVPLRVKVAGVAGVPAGVDGEGAAGVALNVTAVRTSGWGFLQVWPCGSGKPSTSSVNFTSAGAVEPNAVLVPVDATGEVCVSSSVATDLLVDVAAWFESGLESASGELRLVDTRDGTGGVRLSADVPLRVKVAGVAGVPAGVDGEGAAGVALNVTAVRTSGWGFLQVWPCGSGKPSTSSVNFTSAGAVEPNAVLVPVDATGEVCVSSSVATDLLVDVAAWFESGLESASGELRLVDTRDGTGGVRLSADVPLRVKVAGVAGVPAGVDGEGAAGVALNVTAVRTSGWGFLQVWPCGSGKPSTSSVNFTSAGAVEPNAVLVPVDATGEVCVSSSVATDLLVDVTGWFDDGLRAGSGDLRLVDTRIGKGPR
jgi:hypothetical protein